MLDESDIDRKTLVVAAINVAVALMILFMLVGCGSDGADPTATEDATSKPKLEKPKENKPAPTPAPVPTPTPTPEPTPTPTPTPAPPELMALAFAGVMAIGHAEGTFSYALNGEPIQTNRGTLNNAIYSVSAFNFLVTSTREDILPSMALADTMADLTADLCVGTCLASPTRMVILTIKNPEGFGLQIAFELQSESNLPPTRIQIGAFVQAIYGNLNGVPIALFLEGQISQQ